MGARKDSGHCRKIGTVRRLSQRAERNPSAVPCQVKDLSKPASRIPSTSGFATPLHTNPNPSSVALPPRERSCAHAAAHISEHKKLKTAGHILRSSRAELVAAHKQPATCEQFHHFPPSQKNSKFFINFFPLFATYI